jgi:cytochrome c oxidase cbb3-type subunit 3
MKSRLGADGVDCWLLCKSGSVALITLMLSRSNLPGLLAVILLLGTCTGYLAYSQSPQHDLWEEDFQRPSPSGQRTFTSTCAACHGLDGRGGKTGPNIASNSRLEHLSEAEISAIVTGGIPGTGMPAFRSLPPAKVHALLTYLRVLQGQTKTQKLPGDSTRGKAVFFEKGECSSCHAMRGEGAFAGPDLTIYGVDRSAREILDAIIHPRSGADAAYKVGTVVTQDGRRFRGSIRNEDNFSLQLQDTDGSFHFLLRSDVKDLEYEQHSLMPADYEKRLSRSELNDLVSYLMSAGRIEKIAPGAR